MSNHFFRTVDLVYLFCIILSIGAFLIGSFFLNKVKIA